MELDQETLRRLLDYDPETGALTWRERPAEMFESGAKSAQDNARTWNRRFAGKPAFATNHGNGYLSGRVLGIKEYAHRVAWMIAHGTWPRQIDHINGIKKDNRASNLRSVFQSENMKNTRLRSDNTSGFVGVSWDKRKNMWLSGIKIDGRRYHVGYFAKLNDAVTARRGAERKYGFHENHGRAT